MIFIISIFLAYIYAIKLFRIDVYFMNVNPYIGNILQMFARYSGADMFYSYLLKKGIFGQEEKEKEIEKEIFELEQEFDMV